MSKEIFTGENELNSKFAITTIDSYCKLTKTELVFKRDVTKVEWQAVFGALNYVEGCVQFWIGDCLKYREQKWGMYDDVADETGIDKNTLREYKRVAENVESALRNADLGFAHHKEVAKLEPVKQKEYLQRAVDEGLNVRELRAEVKKENYNKVELPTDKYRVIYADPPWEYNDKQDIEALGGATKHYQTMGLDEICAMPINEIADDNAVLFIWTTSPLLEDSFSVIESWGFKYKTSFIWDKVKHNMGHYNSVRHELLLVCTKGSCTPDNIKLFDSVQTIEKTGKHSEKPEGFREIIETLYTKGKKIELFARIKTKGWEVYGNEL